MAAPKQSGPVRRFPTLLFFLILTAALLAVLFREAFQSGYVHFGNDLPLGALSAKHAQIPETLTGWWSDLNWVGAELPMAALNFTSALKFVADPILFSKIAVPISLMVFGLSAFFFFRQLQFTAGPAILGGMAAALNMHYFSNGCWGLYSWVMMGAGIFLALAFLSSKSTQAPWVRFALAGFCVGLAVTEGFDSGAILSLFVGAYAFWQGWITPGLTPSKRLFRGLQILAVVALLAGCFAAQTIINLVQSQVQGVSMMKQDQQSADERWMFATQWSLPPGETSRILVPGLYGYRMDKVDGSRYWGKVGTTPSNPNARFSGSGEYTGVVVMLGALFALAAALGKNGNALSLVERKQVWFWVVAAIVSLLLSYGRYTPLYQFFYAIPFMSTIRNPIKFMHVFHVAIIILFGYGLQAMSRLYLESTLQRSKSLVSNLQAVMAKPSFEKRWIITLGVLVGLSVLWWILYAGSGRQMTRAIETLGTGVPAAETYEFSRMELTLFVLAMISTAAVFIAALSGGFTGKKARAIWVALGLLLVVDLARADAHWVNFYDHRERYASNPVLDFIKDHANESRVTFRKYPQRIFQNNHFISDEAADSWGQLCNEWLEHHFQFYNIRTLDIIQMPRMPELDSSMIQGFMPIDNNVSNIGRLWELTNTRYLVGMSGFLDVLNSQFDPEKKRFRIVHSFNLVPKVNEPRSMADLKPELAASGAFAIIEFTGALPRAVVFSKWQTSKDDASGLAELKSKEFDPHSKVIVAGTAPTSPSEGNTTPAEILESKPRRIKLKATATGQGILMLNERWHPDWKATVDGKPSEVVRVNHFMRGVWLTNGSHEVVFEFKPKLQGFYVSALSTLVAVVLAFIYAVKFRARPV